MNDRLYEGLRDLEDVQTRTIPAPDSGLPTFLLICSNFHNRALHQLKIKDRSTHSRALCHASLPEIDHGISHARHN